MSTERLSEPLEVLTMTSSRGGRRVVIELVGELDLDGAGRFGREVASMLEEPVEVIEVDATELTFADSAGLRSLLLAREAAARCRVRSSGSSISLGWVRCWVDRSRAEEYCFDSTGRVGWLGRSVGRRVSCPLCALSG